MTTSRGVAGEPRQHASAGQTARRSFMELLRARWEVAGTLLCVGLDPELERLPETIRTGGDSAASREGNDGTQAGAKRIEQAILAFNTAIVDATADLVCAFKPNSAFYEAHGPAGLRALLRTIAYLHDRYPNIPVILDAKRGDIGSTSAAYARAAFDVAGADAVTLQPYLGRDALAPFLDRADRGCLILCRTSNPRAGELQDLLVAAGPDGTPLPLYQVVARAVAERWNTNGNCALVVGATYPDELRTVRGIVGDMPMLVPGIGAQGGDLEATLDAGLDSRGQGLIISASRSVLYASAGPDFAQAARTETLRLHDAIDQPRRSRRGH
ncbi:MAG TPA: orotidine-5'-phosphate decarboxylase [Ktedonobacterales bacterium]